MYIDIMYAYQGGYSEYVTFVLWFDAECYRKGGSVYGFVRNNIIIASIDPSGIQPVAK